MLGSIARFDRMLLLTVAVALAGAVLAMAFALVEAFNDPPRSGVSSVGSVEAYQDRARWFQTFEGIGELLIRLALPLAIVTFALARRASDVSAAAPDDDGPSSPRPFKRRV